MEIIQFANHFEIDTAPVVNFQEVDKNFGIFLLYISQICTTWFKKKMQ